MGKSQTPAKKSFKENTICPISNLLWLSKRSWSNFSCFLLVSDRQTSKNKELTGHTVVRVDFRVWGQIVEGHYQYPHVISTFCFQRCTVWRVAGNTFFTYAWKGNRTASSDARVGVWVSFCTSEWLCGRNQKSTINYYDNPRWQKSSS